MEWNEIERNIAELNGIGPFNDWIPFKFIPIKQEKNHFSIKQFKKPFLPSIIKLNAIEWNKMELNQKKKLEWNSTEYHGIKMKNY